MKNNKNWPDWLFSGLVSTGVLFIVLLATPFAGMMSAGLLASVFDCHLTAKGPEPCLILGVDMGERLYGYAVPFIGSLLTPLAFFYAFWEIVVLWAITCLSLSWYLKRNKNPMFDPGDSE